MTQQDKIRAALTHYQDQAEAFAEWNTGQDPRSYERATEWQQMRPQAPVRSQGFGRIFAALDDESEQH